MSTIQVNGTGFLTSSQLTLRFSQSDGGNVTDSRFIPKPSVGSPPVGYTVSQWTDTLIEIGVSDATVEGLFLAEVEVHDLAVTYTVSYDLIPDIVVPAAVNITIANVVPAGPNYIGVSGTDLDQTTRFRVFDNFAFDQVYYDSSGPNAGLNPPGSTVTVYGPTSVIIGDTAMAGLTITQVQARVDPGNTVADEWFGSALVEQFAVSYDGGTDEIVIQSALPFFTGPEAIEFTTDQSSYLVANGQYTFTATEARIPSASAYGAVVSAMLFWDTSAQGVQIGEWNGSVDLF